MKPQKNKLEVKASGGAVNTSGTPGAGRKDLMPILTTAFKLLLISAVTALLLAGVNALTVDKIAENNAIEKTNAINSIFPEANENELIDITAEDIDEVYLVMSDGNLLGYAASVSPNGFGGEMNVIVGVNSDGTLAGIEIVSHSETPGLGSRVGDESFLSQFTGRSGQLSFGDGIDAITGSTISSKTILDGVNKALAVYGMIFTENDVIDGGGAK